jgi:hypothetical protein
MSYEADFIVGGYSIAAHEQKTFDFWFPGGKANEYFDVQVMPEKNQTLRRVRLREIERERVWQVDDKGVETFKLLLTIRNEESVPVDFQASHIRIPNH